MKVQTTHEGEQKNKLLWDTVVGNMENDEIKDIVTSDILILEVGNTIVKSRKPGKLKRTITTARTAMRRLGRLSQISGLCAEELFQVKHLTNLEEALFEMGQGQGKSGLHTALGALVKTACKTLVPYFLCVEQKEKAERIREFLEVFSSPTVYARNFAAAEYCLKMKRQTENRKPANLPDEENYQRLMNYLKDQTSCTKFPEKTGDYIELRRNLHVLLTLVNGRRGNEVSELTVQDWEARGSWIPSKKTYSDEEKEIMKRYHVLFITGKNDKLLPIFVPSYCASNVSLLASSELRKKFGINLTNNYLFSYTQHSEFQVTGYNELRTVCKGLGIPIIGATANRHRSSTLIWDLEIDDQKLNAFLQHIGHSKDIDQNIYACPPAVSLLKNVAPVLETISKAS